MKVIRSIKKLLNNVSSAAKGAVESKEGISNHSTMMNQRLNELISCTDNQTKTLQSKLEQLIVGIENQARIDNQKLNEIIKGIQNETRTLQHQLAQLVEASINMAQLNNQKFNELIKGTENQTRALHHQLAQLIEGAKNQGSIINKKPSDDYTLPTMQFDLNEGYQAPLSSIKEEEPLNVEEALKAHPLMFGYKTYNTSHPDYDANVVRNFPGKTFYFSEQNKNPIFLELKKLLEEDEISESRWRAILDKILEEVRAVPHADQVFERKKYVEDYLNDLEAKNHAFYRPGWVNLDDALFLYWVVRHLKPKVIVQTGVCNGLSSAFMMLALAKNGSEGSLHVIDMPPVYDSKDPNWKVRNKVYGVVIPEGKTSGWLVPDAYRDRFEVLNGDAKLLLPGLLAKVGSIDMFYHDSDHTYEHMLFEFTEAKKYLQKNGIIVSDDISWNASLWDFADEYQAPSYNYRGSMGISCF